MTRSSTSIVLSCLLLTFAVGCYSYRDSATVDVRDIGDVIETKYRYRLVGVNIVGDKCDEVLNNNLVKGKFPSVFSDAGIPFEVVYPRLVGPEFSGGWTFLVNLCSLTLVPSYNCESRQHKCSLRFVEDTSVETRFHILLRQETAESAYFPTGLIPLSGAPESDGNKVFWNAYKGNLFNTEGEKLHTSRHLAMTLLNFVYEDMSKDAFAYGVAAKLKEMEDSGQIDAMLRKLAAAKAPQHRVMRFSREAGCDFTYSFAIEIEEMPINPDKVKSAVLQEFGESVKDEYVETFPNVKQTSLVVNYSDVEMVGKIVQGRATVFTIKPLSLSYDANTRRGKLSVRFNPGQLDEARTWILRNIETLARDKNIALVTGQLPPVATYYSLGEKIDGNVMTIEFRTE